MNAKNGTNLRKGHTPLRNMSIFFCDTSNFGPRWTGRFKNGPLMAHLRETTAFILSCFSSCLFSLFIFTMLFFFLFFCNFSSFFFLAHIFWINPCCLQVFLWSLHNADGDQEFRDRSTGLPLNSQMVKKAGEFYALTKSASRALGAVAKAADMSKVVKPRVRVDATASKAIASRRGRVRHLHTQVLSVQEVVARRELIIVKVLGVENPSDMGTNTWLRGKCTNA